MSQRLETMFHADGEGINERAPNYRDGAGGFYLVRCFACEPAHGRENYAQSVGIGRCCWCGATEVAPPPPSGSALDSPVVIAARAEQG